MQAQTTSNKRMLFALFLIYFLFAILLNSVGTVILQVIKNYEISKSSASVLEGFKDIPIAVVSFAIASFLPRIGYKRAILIGLAIVTLACLMMANFPGFLTAKLLFLSVGVSFALAKVSVYSCIGLITTDRKKHASLMNTLEGFFMVGVLSGYWIFAYFISPSLEKSTDWLRVYWFLAGLCAVVFVLVASTSFDESGTHVAGNTLGQDFMAMLKLCVKPLVCVYVISVFMYVLIEQSIGTWLPTFNYEILKLPTAMAVQMTSIYAGCLAVGRLSAGALMQKLDWYPVLNACILGMAILILVTLPLTENIQAADISTWANAPIAAYIFPLIGLFMAPIYPGINSVMLSSLPKPQHAAMTGLLVIFSALGGTSGSMLTGYIFGHLSGQTAFYLTLVPLAIIVCSLYFFRRSMNQLVAAVA